MDDRLILDTLLKAEFPDLNVYYNPSSKIDIVYPCIVYNLTRLSNTNANNRSYSVGSIFQVSLLHVEAEHIDLKKMFNIPFVEQINTFTQKDITNNVFAVRVNTT
jgi:hypothetical protein